MNGPTFASRIDRGVSSPRSLAVARGAKSDDGDLTADQQAQIAAQHAAFDFDLAERAELLREHEVLQALVMEQLKNEDEIVKKWIALI